MWYPALVYPKTGPYTPKTVAFWLSQQGAHTPRDPVKDELLSVGDTAGKQNIHSSKPQRTSMQCFLSLLPSCLFCLGFSFQFAKIPKLPEKIGHGLVHRRGRGGGVGGGVITALGTAQTKGLLLMHWALLQVQRH